MRKHFVTALFRTLFTMKPQEVKPKVQTDWLGFCKGAHNVREVDVCTCSLHYTA